jgi:hypothetical protein
MREVRLHNLSYNGKKPSSTPQGIEAVRLGLLDFLDLISALPEPVRFYLVFTEGQLVYLADENFGKLFMDKLMKLFESGHRLSVALRIDRVVSDVLCFHKTKLYAHLKGYIKTQYYDDFWMPVSEKILGIVEEKLALKVTRETLLDFDNTSIEIYNDPESIRCIRERIHEYLSISQPLMRYGFFDNPNGYLRNVKIRNNRPNYIISHLPHFGIMPPDELVKSFALSEDEFDRLQGEFYPVLLNPDYYDKETRIRHIFCKTAIDSALLKKRHQVHAMSAMLGRKVWMSTPDLVRRLINIQTLLKTRENYEVCFLDYKHFNHYSLQTGVWGNETSIIWLDNKESASCKEYPLVKGMYNYCITLWEEIPAEMRSRAAVNRKLNQWIRTAEII